MILRLQIPQSSLQALRVSPCKYVDVFLNEDDAVRHSNYLPDRKLPPAPACAELRIHMMQALELYKFALSVKEGRIGGGGSPYTEGYLALEEALRPFCSEQLDWLMGEDGMERIWAPGWMVVCQRFPEQDRVDMILLDQLHGSAHFVDGDHREAYKKVAHGGFEAIKEVHWGIRMANAAA